ncbi:ClpP/crotonase-like domain-containing protein [Hyaloraphidium curvatum]|nr:ClpP/crotonase-like domain-containing protein [Hyaloraphidium curvatum]
MVRLAAPRRIRDPSKEPFEQILYHVDPEARVGVITLNRPKYRNAFGRIMTLEVDEAFTAMANDDRVRVIVLTGAGDHFCSGHDLSTPQEVADEVVTEVKKDGMRGSYERWYSLDLEMCLKWRSIRKPVICAAKGWTIYHGAAVMSVADIVIAADDLRYFPSLVEFTSLPWDLHLNARKAKEIFFSQRIVLAEEAFQIGLVNKVVPKERLDEEAFHMAKIIARSDPFHLAMMKLSVNQALDTAGLTVDVRNNLSHWTAYRASADDPSSIAVKEGGKRFAPVPQALEDDVLQRLSMEASIVPKNAKIDLPPKSKL